MFKRGNKITLEYRVYYAPKKKMELHHYEDAFALQGRAYDIVGDDALPNPHVAGSLSPDGDWRCVIADGATEGGFSRHWAQLLTRQFVHGSEAERPPLGENLDGGIGDWLRNMSKKWVNEYIPTMLEGRQPGPARSRIQQQLMQGQAATLTMLQLIPEQRKWMAACIGDAMLFHESAGQITDTRPLAGLSSTELDNNPILISSKIDMQQKWIWENQNFLESMPFVADEFELGDRFIMATDALAAWILRTMEHDQPAALAKLLSVASNDEFQDLVTQLREEPMPLTLKNDDITLLVVSIKKYDKSADSEQDHLRKTQKIHDIAQAEWEAEQQRIAEREAEERRIREAEEAAEAARQAELEAQRQAEAARQQALEAQRQAEATEAIHQQEPEAQSQNQQYASGGVEGEYDDIYHEPDERPTREYTIPSPKRMAHGKVPNHLDDPIPSSEEQAVDEFPSEENTAPATKAPGVQNNLSFSNNENENYLQDEPERLVRHMIREIVKRYRELRKLRATDEQIASEIRAIKAIYPNVTITDKHFNRWFSDWSNKHQNNTKYQKQIHDIYDRIFPIIFHG